MLQAACRISRFCSRPRDVAIFTNFLTIGKSEETVNVRSRLAETIDKLRDGKPRFEEIKALLQEATEARFAQGDYSILSYESFTELLNNVHSHTIVNSLALLHNNDFFAKHHNFVGNGVVDLIIENVRARPDKASLLELIKYHQQFIERRLYKKNFFPNEQDFQAFVQNIRRDNLGDVLSLYYHFYHLNTSSIITPKSLNGFLSDLMQIRWKSQGTSKQQLVYQENHLSNLLTKRYSLNDRSPLVLFLADIFFASKTYQDALLAVSLVFVLMDRLDQRVNDLSDVLHAYQKHFGETMFKYYFHEQLPIVLQSLRLNQQYQRALGSFTTPKQWSNLCALDSHFSQGNQIVVEHKNVHLSEPIWYSVGAAIPVKGEDAVRQFILDNDLAGLKGIVAQRFGLPYSDDIIEIARRKIDADPTLHPSKMDFPFTRAPPRSGPPRILSMHETPLPPRQPRAKFSSLGKDTLYVEEQNQERLGKTESVGSGFLSYLKKSKFIDKEVVEEVSRTQQVKWQREQAVPKPVEETKTSFTLIKTKDKDELKPIFMVRREESSAINDVQAIAVEARYQLKELASSPDRIQAMSQYFQELPPEDELSLAILGALALDYPMELYKLFFDTKSTGTTKGVDLVVEIESQDGTLEKDYTTYLGGYGVFPYSLSGEVYDELLRRMLVDEGRLYKKRYFKRLIAHIAMYETTIAETTLELILKLTREQRTPLTLIEAINLFIKRNIQLTQDQVFNVIALLRRYREHDEFTDKLMVLAYESYKWTLSFELFRPYILNMIEKEETVRHLNLYEMLKDATLGDLKRQTTKQEAARRRELVMNYALGYIDVLLLKQHIDVAKKVLEDLMLTKCQLNRAFYGMWIQAHTHEYEKAIQIFDDYTTRFPTEIDANIVIRICRVGQRNAIRMREYITNMVTQFVFSNTVTITSELAHELSYTLHTIKEPMTFSTLTKQIVDQRIPINYETKQLWIRAMKACNDDSIKNHIRTHIESVLIINNVRGRQTLTATQTTNPTTSTAVDTNFTPKQEEVEATEEDFELLNIKDEKRKPAKKGKYWKDNIILKAEADADEAKKAKATPIKERKQ